MPISSTAIIPYIVEDIIHTEPRRVLDIGIGNGIYGALIYNYATTIMKAQPVIDGIEAWEKYRGPLWECYHEIHTTDLMKAELSDPYDVIIMADVIEHLTLPQGHQALDKYFRLLNPGGRMYVSTPAVFVAQGAHKGNAYETHRSLWTPKKFEAVGMQPVRPPETSILGEQMLIYKYEQP